MSKIETKDGKVSCTQLGIDVASSVCAKCKQNMLGTFIKESDDKDAASISMCMA